NRTKVRLSDCNHPDSLRNLGPSQRRNGPLLTDSTRPDQESPMAAILSLHEAVKQFIQDGDSVALEGFTHLIPTAAGHEIIRQGTRDLTLARMTPALIYDQLIGAGCARKLIFSWGGTPGVGSLHRLRDAVEKQWPHAIEIEEHSHADLANAYVAGASGLPFAV